MDVIEKPPEKCMKENDNPCTTFSSMHYGPMQFKLKFTKMRNVEHDET